MKLAFNRVSHFRSLLYFNQMTTINTEAPPLISLISVIICQSLIQTGEEN